MTNTRTTPVVAIDLGKYKSLACVWASDQFTSFLMPRLGLGMPVGEASAARIRTAA